MTIAKLTEARVGRNVEPKRMAIGWKKACGLLHLNQVENGLGTERNSLEALKTKVDIETVGIRRLTVLLSVKVTLFVKHHQLEIESMLFLNHLRLNMEMQRKDMLSVNLDHIGLEMMLGKDRKQVLQVQHPLIV